LIPVVSLGAAISVYAFTELVETAFTPATAAALLLLLAAAVLAEAFPVPIQSVPAGQISLAAVFVVGTAMLYDWEAATVVALFARAGLELAQRRRAIRVVYDSSAYALAGAAAGLGVWLVPDRSGVGALILATVLGAFAFYCVNIVLGAALAARWEGEALVPLVVRTVYLTAGPFGIMASVTLMLQVLWQRSPLLALALLGPLLAIVLYQRSVYRALAAMRLALTDPLTGLGNQRHFRERLQVELDLAQAAGEPLTLCLLDVDDFKRVNDRYGHPAGDGVLVAVAGSLRQGGEAFRLGGDEFALVLPGRDELAGLAVAEAVAARLHTISCGEDDVVGASVGVAAYPAHGLNRSELVRAADDALYLAKREGKDRVCLYGPGLRVVEPPQAVDQAG
jgi:diguanylate cyclase (GGDEF)-like protein